MSEQSPKYQWGVTLACLGGLFTILGTSMDESPWEMILLVGAVVLALVGLYMMQAARKEQKNQNEQES